MCGIIITTMEETTMDFGSTIKRLRLAQGRTLRAFCLEVGVEPGNYSKMERGLMSAPKDDAKLEPYRKALCLDSESSEWRELLRLAALSRGEIPHRVLSDKELVAKLPALFRTLEEDGVRDEAALDELVAATRREFSS